jgi:hypothetical protein
MVCCTLHAAISQQPLPREKQHPSQRQTVSAMLATSRPAHTVRSTDVKQQKKCFHVKICNTPTKTKTSQFAAGECCCYSIVNEHHDALAIDDTTSRASAVSPPPARPKGSTVQQASPSQTCKHGNVPMSMKQVNRRIKTHPICSNNTSCTSNNTKRRPPCNENGHGCCQACLPCVTELVLPRLQTRQQSLSVTFSIQTHNRCISKTFHNTLYKSYRVHGALLLGCIGVGCCPMALVGCTQMATDTTGLLQRMLPRFMMCTDCGITCFTNPIGCTARDWSDALGSDEVEWLWSAEIKWLRTCLGCCNGCYQN